MKFRMKKSCWGCRANTASVETNTPDHCELGYPIAWLGCEAPNRHISIPLSPCPKPKTYKDYFYATKWYRYQNLK